MARRRNNITAKQWFWRSREMLESPAWRTLSLSGRRALDRITLELMSHAGNDNGRLPVRYEDFVGYGIDRHAVAPALREIEALGFIEVTQRGRASAGKYRWPNYFRLTDRDSGNADPTNDWRRIKSIEEAQAIARPARKDKRKAKRSKRHHRPPAMAVIS